MIFTGLNQSRRLPAWTLAGALCCFRLQRAVAEAGHVDYRYELYQEDDHRIKVETHSLLFDLALKPRVLSVKGEVVYDAISGASPSGVAGLKPKPLHDKRNAGNLELTYQAGAWSFSPQLSVSEESDYESFGVALNTAVDLNQKNTMLRFGAAHSFDRALDGGSPRSIRHKDSTDLLVGITQLFSPRTLATLDFTYGEAEGYLNDPYKQIRFDGYLPGTFRYPESRPDHRTHETVMLTLTHFFDPLNASAEAAYRFYHDTFGVDAHTFALAWYQKIGKHVILAPLVRYYAQSAADFYHASMPGFEDDAGVPQFFSADYRLSHLETFTAGLQATVICRDWLTLDFGYKRYVMCGLDGVTAQSMYPAANVFTVGARFIF